MAMGRYDNTTLPIGTANLVSGQQDYSFDDTMLTIERVESTRRVRTLGEAKGY